MFTGYIPDKGFTFYVCVLKRPQLQQEHNQYVKWATDLDRYFSKNKKNK